MKCPNRHNHRIKSINRLVVAYGWEEGGWYERKWGVSVTGNTVFWVCMCEKMFEKLIVVMTAQLCGYTNNNLIIYFK